MIEIIYCISSTYQKSNSIMSLLFMEMVISITHQAKAELLILTRNFVALVEIVKRKKTTKQTSEISWIRKWRMNLRQHWSCTTNNRLNTNTVSWHWIWHKWTKSRMCLKVWCCSLFSLPDDLKIVLQDIQYSYQKTALDILLAPCFGFPLISAYEFQGKCKQSINPVISSFAYWNSATENLQIIRMPTLWI